jgi:aspartate kinase
MNELEEKLEKAPSLDYNFEYDQIICFGELVSTCIVSEFLNVSGKLNQWVDARTVIRTDDLYRDANIDWELTEEFCSETFTFENNSLYIRRVLLVQHRQYNHHTGKGRF